MEVKNIARRIVKNNLCAIENHLLSTGIMFDDAFDEGMTRPVAREVPKFIEKEFGLKEKGITILRDELFIKDEYKGVYYRNDFSGLSHIKEFAETHYY